MFFNIRKFRVQLPISRLIDLNENLEVLIIQLLSIYVVLVYLIFF